MNTLTVYIYNGHDIRTTKGQGRQETAATMNHVGVKVVKKRVMDDKMLPRVCD